MKSCIVILTLGVAVFWTACGGGGTGSTTPPPTTYTIGGTVTGLVGTGLVLQDNGGNNLTVSASGSFTFTTALASGSAYKVTVLTQPSSPAQTCVVTNGSGTANANVTNVQVACTTTTYTIGGTISGLAGTGLVLQDNGGNNLTISAKQTTFTFSTAINSGSSYEVSVLTQPSNPTQTCAVANGSGTANANVTNVQVTCTPNAYTIGGTVSGLAGTGLVLQNNGGNNLTISANGPFTFTTSVDSGGKYNVTVLTQPSNPGQSCVVTNSSGTAAANVTNVQVTCTTLTYTIGGTITGLAGTGLVLQDNGGNNLTLNAKQASFTFSTAIDSGSGYKVSVLTQPSSPAQICVVTNGSGTATANVTNVQVACTTTTYTIGGSVSGLSGTGLVLQDNGGNNLTINANGPFTFTTAIDSGSTYSVTVLTPPSSPSQNCLVTNGSGTANANVTNVQVTCTIAYTIGGTVSGLSGSGLVLQDNLSNNLAISANGPFAFTTAISSGGSYSVTVLTQPSDPGQNCVVTNGSGTASANITNVQVTCTTIYYTIGGTVSGMSGSGLVLQDNGDDNLTIKADGSFTFETSIPSGFPYTVTILTEPSSPAQTCGVGNGNGTANGIVTNVLISCSNYWTWENGPDVYNQPGSYGALKIAASGNVPGGRYSGANWTDTTGNFWLFGGYGYDSEVGGTVGNLNDLWEYSLSSGEWTWMGGSNIKDQKGIYGTLGTGASGNIPGARDAAVTWTDAAGNFWMFGGFGYDSGADTSQAGELNDLWEYSAGVWTWKSGSDLENQAGTYGTMGTGAAGNIPGARDSAVSWIDKSGNLWLFGGTSTTGTTTVYYNDLWEYNPTGCTTGCWTWVSGSDTTDQTGIYGTLGTGALGNVPGARESAVSWTDTAGNFWLFGGYGYDSETTPPVLAKLSDLWEYSTTACVTGCWTWKGGYHLSGQPGIYGTQTVAGPTNIPGARQGPTGWTDANGDFWLFGGVGFDSTDKAPNELNDLWKYNVSSGEWAWMSGSEFSGQTGVYGTLGVRDPNNFPGARGGSVGWIDTTGNLWLFGGNGPESGVNGAFSDLWMFVPLAP